MIPVPNRCLSLCAIPLVPPPPPLFSTSAVVPPARYPKPLPSNPTNNLTLSPSPLPKPHLRNLLIPPILQIPHFHHQLAPHPPHLPPLIAVHLRSQLPRQQLHLRLILRNLDLVFFDRVTLDAAGACGAAQWFGDGFGVDDLGGAGVEGGVG